MYDKKIALCGFYGKSNYGDDFMAYHLSNIISQYGRHEVTVYSDCTANDVVDGIKNKPHLDNDIIVIGGGGIISPGFWVFRNGAIEELIESGKPVFFFNVNLVSDSLENALFQKQIKALNATWWVRDKNSVNILKEKGISSILNPDISFRKGIVPFKKTTLESKNLTLFANSYVFEALYQNNSVNNFLIAHRNVSIIAEYLDWMANFGWNIKLIPAQVNPEIDDRVPSALIYSHMTMKHKASWESNYLKWEKVINIIASSDLVLSMRYHSTTVALASGVPIIDITHHDKNKMLLQELNLKECSVDYWSLTKESLISATNAAEKSFLNKKTLQSYLSNADIRWKKFEYDWNKILKGL